MPTGAVFVGCYWVLKKKVLKMEASFHTCSQVHGFLSTEAGTTGNSEYLGMGLCFLGNRNGREMHYAQPFRLFGF